MILKTRTKVVHKNVSQCCNKNKKSKGKHFTQPLDNMNVNWVTLKLKETIAFKFGSSGIATTWDCTHFLNIGFVVARGGLNSYYNPQCIQLDKERNFVTKRLVLWLQKDIRHFLENGCNPMWVQFHAYLELEVWMGNVTTLPFYG